MIGDPLQRNTALSRWAGAVHLQKEIDHVNEQFGVTISRLAGILHSFDSCFPCRESTIAFWDEVKDLTWPFGASPWDGVAALARELQECESGSPPHSRAPSQVVQHNAVLAHLHEHALERWSPGRQGFAYVIQELKDGADEAWTSIPMWAASVTSAEQDVVGGWTNSSARWATLIGRNDAASRFVFGVDSKGRPIKPDAVSIHLPHEWLERVKPASRINESEHTRERAVG